MTRSSRRDTLLGMQWLRAAVVLGAGLVVLAAACSSGHPSVYTGIPSSTSSSGGEKPPGFQDGRPKFTCADLKPPDGGKCDCIEQDLVGEPPNMYFVLDRSGSMLTDDKWTKIKVVVANVVRALGRRINVGVTVYPAVSSGCATGAEVLSLRRGDAPQANDEDGPTTLALIQAMNVGAGGGTPTSATLVEVAKKLKSAKGKTFVVLATDGAPNCTSTPCTAAKCSLNVESMFGCTPLGANCCVGDNVQACVDDDGTNAAVKALKDQDVSTFVIGVPGVSPYADLLDRLAQTGGTARPQKPFYYPVDTASEADFTAAMKKVAAQILATCTFVLSAVSNPDEINVYLDDVLTPKSDADGWKVEGNTVTLTGATCRRALAGDVLDVRVVSGCPTVIK